MIQQIARQALRLLGLSILEAITQLLVKPAWLIGVLLGGGAEFLLRALREAVLFLLRALREAVLFILGLKLIFILQVVFLFVLLDFLLVL